MTRTRKVAAAALSVLALSITAAPIASADPAFGPGQKGGGKGNSGPQEGKCHPPGQTNDRSECK